MPTANPCLQCREKHVKCDDDGPYCHRCTRRGLECTRPTKVVQFRHDNLSRFSGDQKWVKSHARKFQLDAHTPSNPSYPPDSPAPTVTASPGAASAGSPVLLVDGDGAATTEGTTLRPWPVPETNGSSSALGKRRRTEEKLPELKVHLAGPLPSPIVDQYAHLTPPTWHQGFQEVHPHEQSLHNPWQPPAASHQPADHQPLPVYPPPHIQSPTAEDLTLPIIRESVRPRLPPPRILTPSGIAWPSYNEKGDEESDDIPDRSDSESPALAADPPAEAIAFPLPNIQEAALLRYYIGEISHWLDLTDEWQHFERVVPLRARTQPHLLNAILAVAARHLARMPQYKDENGLITYQNQPLPDLTPHSAVEYMLKCIPALRSFDGQGSKAYLESVVTTAVLLRQLEEIDDEADTQQPPEATGEDNHGEPERMPSPQLPPGTLPGGVNFLRISNAVLHSEGSQSLIGRSALIRAAYWMVLRQEIFHSFTKKQAPQVVLSEEHWKKASNANKAVMHTIQVMKWRWGRGDNHITEWYRLMKQQEFLERWVLCDHEPIYDGIVNEKKGDVFPVVWYYTNIEVTSMQQSLMARAVLEAENPTVEGDRTSWRNLENKVRQLIMRICGIAMSNPNSPPALLHAVFLIQTYGDYFTDKWERHGLKTVVERYRDTRAWPSKNVLALFDE